MTRSSSSTTVIAPDGVSTGSEPEPEPEPEPSSLMSSSLTSTSSRQGFSEISKMYKQASRLFLTRQLQGALTTLESIISQPQSSNIFDESQVKGALPIASATRGIRVKVWSLYLTLLNAIIELGEEAGKSAFGNTQWKAIAAKVRDGTVWDEVVQVGYEGHGGAVDAEVIINLVTLLLGQSPSQSLNQQHLESYLSASNNPIFDFSARLDAIDGHEYPTKNRSSQRSGNGTDTPRDLNLRIRILELYTLHILPRNEEWSYAKDFIKMSEVLDDERKEALLQALQEIENEANQDSQHVAEVRKEQRIETRADWREAEQSILEDERTRITHVEQELKSDGHKRSDSEQDYGIESSPLSRANGYLKASDSKELIRSSKRSPIKQAKLSPRSQSSSKTSKFYAFYGKGAALISALQRLVLKMTSPISKNPTVLLRTVLFLLGMILTLSRYDVKARLRNFSQSGWEKVSRTVGMGIKVSYV